MTIIVQSGFHLCSASKYANSFGINRLGAYFRPNQLGFGTSGGCEAAIHSARRFLQALPTDHVLVKLDFTNAADYLFQPIAVEILGLINESASDFLSLLAKKISTHAGHERETAFLCVSALVQRYNSVLLHDSFVQEDYSE